MFQDGPNGAPTGLCQEHADANARHKARAATTIDTTACLVSRQIKSPGFGGRTNPHRSTPRVDRRTGLTPFHIRPGSIAGPHPLPSRQFQALFDSLFKVLFIFPSRYLFAIGLSPILSLGWNLPPDWGCIPKQPGCNRVRARRGSHPLWRPLPGDLGPVRR